MENFIIIRENTEFFYPTINFNAETGICEIIGESYLEETFAFYKEVLDWLKKYITEKKAPIFFNMKVTYFNTASSKIFREIFDMLKVYQEQGGIVNITWYYHEWDEDMLMEIENFMIDSNVKIRVLPFVSLEVCM